MTFEQWGEVLRVGATSGRRLQPSSMTHRGRADADPDVVGRCLPLRHGGRRCRHRSAGHVVEVLAVPRRGRGERSPGHRRAARPGASGAPGCRASAATTSSGHHPGPVGRLRPSRSGRPRRASGGPPALRPHRLGAARTGVALPRRGRPARLRTGGHFTAASPGPHNHAAVCALIPRPERREAATAGSAAHARRISPQAGSPTQGRPCREAAGSPAPAPRARAVARAPAGASAGSRPPPCDRAQS